MSLFSGVVFLVSSLWAMVLLKARDRPLFQVLLLGFSLRVFAGVANDLVFRFYGYALDSDWLLFERYAVAMYQVGVGSIFDGFITGRFFFGWYSGLLFLVFGVGSFAVVAANVVLGTLAVYLTYRLSLEIWSDRRAALWCAIVAAVLPTLVLHSGSTSREPILIAFFLAACVRLARFVKDRRGRHLFIGLGLLIVPCIIHTAFTPYTVVAAAVLTFPGLDRLFLGRNLPRSRGIGRFIQLAGIGGVVALILAFNFGLDKARFMESGETPLEKLALLSAKSDIYERTAYLDPGEIRLSSPTDLLRAVPKRVFLFLFTPYPSMVRQAADVIGFVVAAAYVILVGFTILSRRELARNPKARFCAWSAVLLILMFSFGTVNYGTASRHKTKMFPILLVAVLTPSLAHRWLRVRGELPSGRLTRLPPVEPRRAT